MVYRYEDATYMIIPILLVTILSLAEIVRMTSVLVTSLVNSKLKHIF